MMIKNWLIRGDTHGDFTWMTNGCLDTYKSSETAIIILGDAGFNFHLNKSEQRHKKEINDRGYKFYCVRGNHEERPQNIPNMNRVYDDEVKGYVYMEEEYPNIRYFLDYGRYAIDKYICLIIGGAYSVDKNWRLSRVGLTEETNDPKKSGWFAEEQLTANEMTDCSLWLDTLPDSTFDFVFSHTCPKKYQPVDKFLSFIDQSTVDTSMETWMEAISKKIEVNYAWLWGHFHTDRIEAPHAEMYYRDIEELDVIADRWKKYDNTGELDWYLVKSPLYYQHEQEYEDDNYK